MLEYAFPLSFIAVALSFLLSASAGMGGSIILVPALSLLLGGKEGISLAALLLATNNIFKVFAYRQTIPFKKAAGVLSLTLVGSALGAGLLLTLTDRIIDVAILSAVALSFLIDTKQWHRVGLGTCTLFALFAGVSSGVAGTSGPLKGLALRNLGLDRFHLLGAASVVSLAGDMTKSAVFFSASLVHEHVWLLFLAALPLMPLATFTGRYINQTIGERAYAGFFWAVMAGYSVRVFFI